MEDVTKKRVLRKLEALPEAQLYQVLDYIEFLEAKYAATISRKPDPFQQFAERVEDQMRVRSLAPKAMKGTMRLMSSAGKFFDGVRGLVQGPPNGASETEPPREPPAPDTTTGADKRGGAPES